MSPADDLAPPDPRAPVAARRPTQVTSHGDERTDDYFWLREKDAPEVLEYLRAERAYADTVTAPLESLRERLYEDIVGRIKETDVTVPYKKGKWLYFSRTEEGKQYPTYLRRGLADGAEPQVLLDLNELAEGKLFLAVSAFAVSPDGNLLAYSTDETGFLAFTLHVKDIRTGELLADRVEGVTTLAWTADSKTLVYTVDDHAKRPYRVFRHVLGADPSKDELVFEEDDERFRLTVWESRSGGVVFLSSNSHTTSEVWFVDATARGRAFEPIARREQDHEYFVEHRGPFFYILTNDKGRNKRVVRAPVNMPERRNWLEVVPHSDTVMRESIDLFRDHMVVREREAGLPHLAVHDLGTGETRRVSFDEGVYNLSVSANEESDTRLFRFWYESLVTPPSLYDVDMTTLERKLLKQKEVMGGYDPSQYVSERIHATARDGTRIPISLVYRKGLVKDGRAPMHLVGYGAYGLPYPVGFSEARLSLLERGVVSAIAHIRGGGEMGKKWHDAGRMFHKKNTFADFIDVAEYLVDQKITSPAKLVIEGRSAGGLLMSAVTNLRPDLFKAVIIGMPFVDVLNTMLDEEIPLTVGEFEEWGNPKVPEEYEYIQSYCPYTNVEKKDYPAMLVTTAYNDSQVMYWEPAKYVAKLRAHKTDGNPLLFRIAMEGGHGGASGRYDKLRETAFGYAFALWQMGITK